MRAKPWIPFAAALGVAFAGSAGAADEVTLQLKWLTQAQFAGYYVAKAKGFYKEAGSVLALASGRRPARWAGR